MALCWYLFCKSLILSMGGGSDYVALAFENESLLLMFSTGMIATQWQLYGHGKRGFWNYFRFSLAFISVKAGRRRVPGLHLWRDAVTRSLKQVSDAEISILNLS